MRNKCEVHYYIMGDGRCSCKPKNVELTTEQIDENFNRQTLEIMTDLVLKYKPEIISKYGGLTNFVDWLRKLDCRKFYIKKEKR